eukprot:Ihof_evm22s22 gene=Ihof_evmTU22s22
MDRTPGVGGPRGPRPLLRSRAMDHAPVLMARQGPPQGSSNRQPVLAQNPQILRQPAKGPANKQGPPRGAPMVVSSIKARPTEGGGTSQGPQPTQPVRAFSRPVKLLTDKFLYVGSSITRMLHDTSDFLVVGVVGGQGAGKSYVLSLVAGLSGSEGPFPVQTSEHQLKAEFLTSGVDMYVTTTGVILLDTQPVMSAAVLDKTMKEASAQATDGLGAELALEIQAIQLMAFLLCVCHVVVVVQDYAQDTSLLRLLSISGTLKPSIPVDTEHSVDAPPTDYIPDIVCVQNKAPQALFTRLAVTELQKTTHALLQGSNMRYRGVCNMLSSRLFYGYNKKADDDASDVNVCLLPVMTSNNHSAALLPGSPQTLAQSLVKQILTAPRRAFNNSMTEKE